MLCNQSPKFFHPVKLRLYSIRQLQFYSKKEKKKDERMEDEEEEDRDLELSNLESCSKPGCVLASD